MMTPVPVAVHRWFAHGEAWAHDPLCAGLLAPNPAAALNVLFDRQLKHPEPGPFLVRTGEGVWVGTLEPDGAVLDPRVSPGDTPILRAALLPYAPDGEVQEAVLRELARLSPRHPGEDAGLALAVSFEGTPEAPRPSRPPLRIPVSLLATAFLLLLAILTVALTRPWQLLGRGSAEPEPSNTAKMAALLRQWGETVPDERADPVVRRFFGLLARPSWAADLDPAAHPYHAFVRRLPALRTRPRCAPDLRLCWHISAWDRYPSPSTGCWKASTKR